jgi:hypothetical protein
MTLWSQIDTPFAAKVAPKYRSKNWTLDPFDLGGPLIDGTEEPYVAHPCGFRKGNALAAWTLTRASGVAL